MQGYGYFLSRVAQPVSPATGESGYFSLPEEHLDPRLFEGEKFRPDVRTWILNTLYTFWGDKFHKPKTWSTVWVAGSGVSYQWAASRGNGDLDVLIGVDYDVFYNANPSYAGLEEADLAALFNEGLHTHLWPSTAAQSIHGGTFEVTYYVNPNATDIRNINPYAAYDLTHDTWTVRPPSGDAFNHPQEYFKAAGEEAEHARGIVDRFNTALTSAQATAPDSPGWHNAMRQVDLLSSQASTLFDSIHLGRKKAFGPGGSGYGDYYNFRWQYHKQQGTVQALHSVAEAHKQAQDEYNTALYGRPIEGADAVLRRAALWNRGVR